jgi:hypothetical protein
MPQAYDVERPNLRRDVGIFDPKDILPSPEQWRGMTTEQRGKVLSAHKILTTIQGVGSKFLHSYLPGGFLLPEGVSDKKAGVSGTVADIAGMVLNPINIGIGEGEKILERTAGPLLKNPILRRVFTGAARGLAEKVGLTGNLEGAQWWMAPGAVLNPILKRGEVNAYRAMLKSVEGAPSKGADETAGYIKQLVEPGVAEPVSTYMPGYSESADLIPTKVPLGRTAQQAAANPVILMPEESNRLRAAMANVKAKGEITTGPRAKILTGTIQKVAAPESLVRKPIKVSGGKTGVEISVRKTNPSARRALGEPLSIQNNPDGSVTVQTPDNIYDWMP